MYCIYMCTRVYSCWICLGGTAEFPSATPLMEKTSREAVAQPSTHRDLQAQTPAAICQKVAFRLGGSEEADLDNSDVETKDTDGASENFLLFLSSKDTQIHQVFGSLFMTMLHVLFSQIV